MDALGVVFVADRDNARVRAVTPDGNVSTYAGSGAVGKVDGAGTGASFTSPQDVKVDSGGGGLYVVDECCIRRVPSAPSVTSVFVGNPDACSSHATPTNNGVGTNALFGYPYGFALNASGDGSMLVADTFNQLTRWVSASGATTDGVTAGLSYPCGVTADARGAYYVSDKDNHRIIEVSHGGGWTAVAGSGAAGSADGVRGGASFRQPLSLIVDGPGSVLYVADTGNNAVRQVDLSSGEVTTISGGGGAGFSDGFG